VVTRCAFLKPNGQQCGAFALRGSQLCFFHDPGSQEKRSAAQQSGGKGRTAKKAPLAPAGAPAQAAISAAPLETVADVVTLLGQTINQIRPSQADLKAANTIGYLANVLLRAIADFEFEREMEKLKAQIAEIAEVQRERLRGGQAP